MHASAIGSAIAFFASPARISPGKTGNPVVPYGKMPDMIH
jgi:hypothetical protein